MLVDQGHVFLFEESVKYEIETIKRNEKCSVWRRRIISCKINRPW